MGTLARTRVVVADIDVVTRAGLAAMLRAGEVEVAGEAATEAQVIDLAERLGPDLLVLNLPHPETVLPRLGGRIRALVICRVILPGAVESAIRAGAAGYLEHDLLDAAVLAAAVRAAAAGTAIPLSPGAGKVLVEAYRRSCTVTLPAPGRHGLTAREFEIMNLIARGRSNGEISRHLCLSENTVKNHVSRIFAKLGTASRGAAIARWLGTSAPDPIRRVS
jgi:DNA-binding NarL/FixJ family response regulator